MAVRDAAGAQFSGDAEFALLADFGALAGELFGVAGVVNHALAFEAVEDGLDHGFVVAAALEGFFHFVDGMGAAHEGADSGVV